MSLVEEIYKKYQTDLTSFLRDKDEEFQLMTLSILEVYDKTNLSAFENDIIQQFQINQEKLNLVKIKHEDIKHLLICFVADNLLKRSIVKMKPRDLRKKRTADWMYKVQFSKMTYLDYEELKKSYKIKKTEINA